MTRSAVIALAVFCAAVASGSLTDVPRVTAPHDPSVLAADFHVHAAPGDGLLPVWEIQREAGRRGLDVIAITNHNHDLALRLARLFGLVRSYPIVIDSQELTTPDFHIAAVGVNEMIDWRLSAVEAIAAIHRAGGVAIASHPGPDSWRVRDPAAIGALDGAEAAHPAIVSDSKAEVEIRAFFDEARRLNPGIAAIGSSDFHAGTPLGLCRTFLRVSDVSREAVLEAVRLGQTIASCPGGRVTGSRGAQVSSAEERLEIDRATRFGYGPSTGIALTSLMALAAVVFTGQPR